MTLHHAISQYRKIGTNHLFRSPLLEQHLFRSEQVVFRPVSIVGNSLNKRRNICFDCVFRSAPKQAIGTSEQPLEKK